MLHHQPHPREGTVADSLGLAVVLGVVGGLLELGILALRKAIAGRWIGMGPEALWLTPWASVLLLLVVALGCAAAFHRARERTVERTALVLLFLVSFGALFIFHPAIHKLAVLLLAIGLARIGAGWVARHYLRFRRPALLAAVAWLGLAPPAVLLLQRQAGRLAAEAVAARPLPSPDAPNILLLILDTVRAADLQLFGGTAARTPTLERLARDGTVFTRAYSTAPWTLPSHASMFTGRWPHEFRADWWQPLGERFPTLGEIFQDAGYATAGFVGNTINCSAESGLDRGFDVYGDHRVSPGHAVLSISLGRFLAGSRLVHRLLGTEQVPGRKSAAVVNAEALGWLAAQGGRPTFLFLNYFDAHAPYIPPAPFDTLAGPVGAGPSLLQRLWNRGRPLATGDRFAEDTARHHAAYAASISALDHEIGRLLDSVAARAPGRRTILVITSDHGEEFGEHGVYEHGLSLYPLSLHVPLLLVDSARVSRGRRVDEVTSLQHLASTIVDLAGVRTVGRVAGSSLFRRRPTAEQAFALAELSWVPNAPPAAPASAGDMRAYIDHRFEYIWYGKEEELLLDLTQSPAGRLLPATEPRFRRRSDWYHHALERLTPDSLEEAPKPTGFTR